MNVPAHVKTIRYRVGLYTNEVPRKHHVHKVGQNLQEMPNTLHHGVTVYAEGYKEMSSVLNDQ